MSRSSGGIPGLALAGQEQRGGLGTGSTPPGLPPGLVPGASGVPRGAANASLNGVTENTGGAANAISALLRGATNAGGIAPRGTTGTRAPRSPEQPSLARSGAISRRLNGGPSRGKELKGL